MGVYDRTYYGGATDIALAKQQGLQGNFYDISKYGDESKYQDLLHAYKTGANPVILGGAGATGGINDDMYQRLMGAGANIQRIGGADRYDVQNNFKNYANALGKQKQVSDIYDQQQKSQLDALKAQKDKALGELTPQYQAKRNQADVVNQQNVTRLRELMAANGISASGENVTAQAAANSQRQQSLNDLNVQEQQQINSIMDPAQEQQIMAQIQAQKAQALLEAQNQSDQQTYQRERDAVADKRYTAEQAWQKFIFDNLSADQKAQLAAGKYSIDATNSANAAASAAELAYYKQMGFNQASGGSESQSTYGNNYKSQQLNNSSNKGAFQTHLNSAVKSGKVPTSWVEGLTELIGRESSWNPTAKNPTSTAYGYGQFLSSTRAAYEKKTGLSYSDPTNQIIMMAQYVKDRYGTPEKALAFWDKNHYY